MTDWLSKWTDASKKQIYPIGWQKERPPDPKWPPKRNHPQQLQTYNVPIDDVENTIDTNLGRDLQFAKEQKGYHKKTRGIGELLYIDQCIFKDNKAR